MQLTRIWRCGAAGLVLCLALSLALPTEAPANVFASNLKSAAAAFAPGAGQSINFSFILNENADTGVTLKVHRASNDQLVREVNLGPLAKGTQVWAWDGKDNGGSTVPLGEAYYFTVIAADDGYTSWTQLTVDADRNKYFSPRGVDVNKNPNSPYYGRIYIAENGSKTATWTGSPKSTQDGVYILNADSTDAVGQGDTARTGGVTWPTSYSSPWKLSVGEDDLIYVCDWTDPTGGLWVGDPDFLSASSLLDPSTGSSAGANANHGSLDAVKVTGIGPNRVVYTADEDYPDATAIRGSIWRYDVGNSVLPWTRKPDGTAYDDNYPRNRMQNQTQDFEIDGEGNVYVTQVRSEGYDTLNSIIKVASDGTLLWTSQGVLGKSDPLKQTYAIALDEARDRVALSSFWNGHISILDSITFNPDTMTYICPTRIFAVGDSGTIMMSTDRGVNWAPTAGVPTTANLYGVYMQSAWTGFTCGAGGAVLRTTNSGNAWELATQAGTADLKGIASYSTLVSSTTTQRIWAVGAGGVIYNSTYSYTSPIPAANTITWTTQTSGTTNDLNCIVTTYISTTKLFACGANGTLLKTTDGGVTWSALSSNITSNLNAMSFSVVATGVNAGWAVGDNGAIVRTEDDGATWSSQVVPGLTEKLVGVTAVTSKVGRILGANGAVLTTNDGGATWTTASAGVTGVIGSAFLDAGTGWAVTSGGSCAATTSGVSTWTTYSSGAPAALNAVFAKESSAPTYRDVAFDGVGNLYGVDPATENLRIFSPPDGPNSSTTRSYGVVVASAGDVTAPSAPGVTDDGANTFDSTKLHFTLTPSSDPESGVVEYRYAISGQPVDIGRGYVVGWTSAGTDTDITATGLNLTSGRYWIFVKAKNGAGIWSDVGVSDGITLYAGRKIGSAKRWGPLNSLAPLNNVVVTCLMSDYGIGGGGLNYFFVEEQDRSAGILVETTLPEPAKNAVLSIVGTIKKGVRPPMTAPALTDNVDYISATDILYPVPAVDPIELVPMWMPGKVFGGAVFGLQPGVIGGAGLNNVGLLARASGLVTLSGADPGHNFMRVVYIDDGSGVVTDLPGVTGIKCYVPNSITTPPGQGTFANITGISDMELVDMDGTPGSEDDYMIRTMWMMSYN